jgi:hypothetical protein
VLAFLDLGLVIGPVFVKDLREIFMPHALMLAFPPLLALLLPVLGPRSEAVPPAAAEPGCDCSWYYSVIPVVAAPAGKVPTFTPGGGTPGQCTYHTGDPGGDADYCDQFSPCSGPFTVTVTANGGTKVWDPNPAPLGLYVGVRTLTWDAGAAGVGCGAPPKTENVRVYTLIPFALVGDYDVQAGCYDCNDQI